MKIAMNNNYGPFHQRSLKDKLAYAYGAKSLLLRRGVHGLNKLSGLSCPPLIGIAELKLSIGYFN